MSVNHEPRVAAMESLPASALSPIFKHVIELSSDAIALSDLADGHFIAVNNAFLRLHGYSREELIGSTSDELRLWNAPAERQQLLARLKDGGGSVDGFAHEYRHKSGRVGQALVSVREVELDGRPHLLGLITNSDQLDEQLRGLVDDARTQRALLERMLDGVAYCRMFYEGDLPSDFVYLQVNPAFEALTGLHDVVGRRASEVIPGIRRSDPRLFEIYGRVARTGVPERFEMRVEALDGWFDVSVFSPQPEHFVAAFDVITERKRAEIAIRTSQSQLAAAMASMRDAVALSDTEGRLIEFNEAFAKFYRFADKASCFRTLPEYRDVFETFLLDGRPALPDEWPVQRALRGESGTEVQYLMRRRDSGESWIGSYSFAPVRDAAGAITGSVVTSRDITDRVHREEALKLANDRLELAQRASGSGLWDWDFATGRLNWTDSLFRLFGLDPGVAEASFETWKATIHPDDRARTDARTLWAAQNKQPLSNEYRVILPSGEIRWIEAVGDVICDAQGNAVRMSGICIDATARKATEAKLREYQDHLESLVARRTQALGEARDAAEAANRAKSAFLANMSHEIRTPMNGILGMAQLMRHGGVTPAQADKLDKIDASAKHLLGIINNVLDLSKVEAGKTILVDQPFEFDRLIWEVRSVTEHAASIKGLSFDIDAQGVPPNLQGDATRLAQALVNYLGNAVKFTDRGGVKLRARVVRDGESDCLIRFEVQDSGIGIPLDQQSRLFGNFEQVPPVGGRRSGGTGLGLAITRHLAHLMGGEVGLVSTPGQGSVFWLTARLGKCPPPATLPGSFEGSAELRLKRLHAGKRVLVVEDNPINREVACAILEQAGLQPVQAVNGAEAVRLAASENFAAILMDMQMPEMDGPDATRAIRRLPGQARTPIVAMTANAYNDDRAVCEAAGMNDFIAKPADPEVLYERLLKWLGSPEGSPGML